jgi:DNA-binding SARP family transcriptional activator
MFRLKTLGGVALERDGVPLEGRVSQRRRLALLAYLAAQGDRPVNRETLVALLWPERDEEHGRHSLSQILYALRSDLAPEAVLSGIDELRLNPSLIGSDIGEFTAAIAQRDWSSATTLYRGPFLEGFLLDDAPELERWAAAERTRIADDYGRALEALAAQQAQAGHLAVAADWWRKRAALDPLDARVACRLMQALVAAGDRSGAIRHAAVHAALLEAELAAGPDPAVATLAAQLRTEAATPIPIPGQRPAEAAGLGTTSGTGAAQTAGPLGGSAKPSRNWRLPTAILAAVALLLTIGSFARRGSAARLAADHRVVLLGEIEGPDTALALAVREVLQLELGTGPELRLLPGSAEREGRRLMGLKEDSVLPAHLLQDLAQRQGAHAVVTGSAMPLGAGTQLTIRVYDPKDGELLLAVVERPRRPEEVIEAVARLGRTVRSRLAALPTDSSIHPLPMVATVSLPALRNYALARQAAARGNRPEAVMLGEAALVEDSLFPLAHYLVGDLLWFLDQQRHSEAHLTRAHELAGRAPLRERLVVQARYQQLVRDRPDSALAFWRLLRAAYPEEALAYEGMAWTLRALGKHREAAAAADSALKVDPGAVSPNANNRLYALLAVGDTAAAQAVTLAMRERAPVQAVEAAFVSALVRGDGEAALRWADSIPIEARVYRQHIALLALGRIDDAATSLAGVRRERHTAQSYPRALLLQATAIAATSSSERHEAARRLTREALVWLEVADLSPPAIGRLAERIACVAAWTGDPETIQRTRRLLEARDAGRDLRSYAIALATLNGALAFARGGYARAAELLGQSLQESFFSRSAATLALLQADALNAAGDTAAARRRYQEIARYQIPDGDFETWPVPARLAAERLVP